MPGIVPDDFCHPASAAVRLYFLSHSHVEEFVETALKKFDNMLVQFVIGDAVHPGSLDLPGGSWLQNVGICGNCSAQHAIATRKQYILAPSQ
jgi:hypothetical protein